MFRKAGHIRRKRNGATDTYGNIHDVLTLFIEGQTFAVRTDEIRQSLHGNLSASIERIRYHWQDLLDGAVGTAYLSRSRKAVIIEMYSGQRYCIPAENIKEVCSGISGSAIISGIPASDPAPAMPHTTGTVQTLLSAF